MKMRVYQLLEHMQAAYTGQMPALDMNEPVRVCPQCFCTDVSACATTIGPCSWVTGSEICSACVHPGLRLSEPAIECDGDAPPVAFFAFEPAVPQYSTIGGRCTVPDPKIEHFARSAGFRRPVQP